MNFYIVLTQNTCLYYTSLVQIYHFVWKIKRVQMWVTIINQFQMILASIWKWSYSSAWGVCERIGGGGGGGGGAGEGFGNVCTFWNGFIELRRSFPVTGVCLRVCESNPVPGLFVHSFVFAVNLPWTAVYWRIQVFCEKLLEMTVSLVLHWDCGCVDGRDRL